MLIGKSRLDKVSYAGFNCLITGKKYAVVLILSSYFDKRHVHRNYQSVVYSYIISNAIHSNKSPNQRVV